MRPIKFRFWHKTLLCYLGYEYSHYHYGPALVEGEIDSDSCDVEQFTGLQDKNGKDVFEGDVLKTNEAGWVAKVIWHYDGFMLTGLDNTGFSCSPDYNECEIIGTIHEGEYKKEASARG